MGQTQFPWTIRQPHLLLRVCGLRQQMASSKSKYSLCNYELRHVIVHWRRRAKDTRNCFLVVKKCSGNTCQMQCVILRCWNSSKYSFGAHNNWRHWSYEGTFLPVFNWSDVSGNLTSEAIVMWRPVLSDFQPWNYDRALGYWLSLCWWLGNRWFWRPCLFVTLSLQSSFFILGRTERTASVSTFDLFPLSFFSSQWWSWKNETQQEAGYCWMKNLIRWK